jgi:tetratricopeptide (TPR) repeat protein
MVVECKLVPGLIPFEYTAKITKDTAVFTGNGLVKGIYTRDLSGSSRMSSYAYRRFLDAIHKADFFSIKTQKPICIFDVPVLVVTVTANGRTRSIKDLEVAGESAQKYHSCVLAIHELTGLNEWLADIFDDGKHSVKEQDQKDPEVVLGREILKRAREFVDSGEHEKALIEYDRARELDPASIGLFLEKCELLKQMKAYDRLAENYKMLLRIDRSQTGLLNDIGQALHRAERFEEAISWYDRAISANPKNPVPMFNKGLSLLETKRFGEAIVCFDFVRIDNWRAYFEKGLCLVEMGCFEEAIKTLGQGLALYPSYPFGLINMARAFNGLGKFEDALRYAEKALAKNPDHSWFLTVRGTSLSGLGRKKEALESLQKAIKLEPKNTEAQNLKEKLISGLQQ